jgi:hypothetical protein
MKAETSVARTTYPNTVAGSLRTACAASLLLLTLPVAVRADFNGTDNFSSGSGKWDALSGAGTASLTVTNGRYEYTATGAGTLRDQAYRRWNVNRGSYTNDWSVQVDVHLSAFPGLANQAITLNLVIEGGTNFNEDINVNRFYAVLINRDGSPMMDFESYFGGSNTTEIANTTTDAALRISFDSAAKTLTAWYDADGPANGYTWIPMETVRIPTGTNGWGMTSNSQFNAFLVVGSGVYSFLTGPNIAVTGAQAYFDNFLATSVLWNPQIQTINASFGVRTNRFGFNITGSSGLVIVVEACTNLSNPVWTSVGTNTLTGGSSYFSDPRWTNYPGRLYRLRSP